MIGTFTFLVSFWFQVVSFYPSFQGTIPYALQVELPAGSEVAVGNVVTIKGQKCGTVREITGLIATLDIGGDCFAGLGNTPVALVTFPGGDNCGEGLELLDSGKSGESPTPGRTIKAYSSYAELWATHS